MSAYPDGFDEEGDGEEPAPLLPADDRIWRHPSEMGAPQRPFVDDQVAVHRRWLASEPSRASAWTAGIVGAILATGLVVLGTHLATALTDTSAEAQPAGTVATLPLSDPTPAPAVVSSHSSSAISLSPALEASIARVSAALAVVDTSFGTRQAHCLAFVIEPDGILLAPAAEVSGASSIVVTLANHATYVGRVVAVDTARGSPRSDLAIVRIEASGLSTIPVDRSPPAVPGQLSLAVDEVGGQGTIWGGTVATLDASGSSGRYPLVDSIALEMPSGAVTPGSALLDDAGGVVGIVTGSSGGTVVAVPTWLAMPVANELLATGHVAHGWLGIRATTADSAGGSAEGVLVSRVLPGGAAARAGLRAGDIVWSVDQHRTTTVNALLGRLYIEAPGTTVRLEVLRQGHLVTISTQLGASPSP